LVNRRSPERVTIDFDLSFIKQGEAKHYPQLVIAEVKQPRFSRQSPFVQALRAQRSQRMGFSKYCIGIATEHAAVKSNGFKPTLSGMARFC
ncbi:MAG: VTC domain-containing protein, partial [Anaerolineae bacterium]|nr:VTC domain-containing protein [Anaerolineae bacterium]